ncbi:colanic acid biosynthesis glycosyl transferase [Candidatus Symbiobacter mobilis]|uniref:Colanic acid biosynthesis glycosyl-transferase n=1 Tax=Candidatus Symbiobacter mobilis CR TaxID=946483 RepID=U5N8T5_9BURK|nr:colanic acid biosynthesis glycosyl transferase [Candidatus Symbiobacter mobilis]AGX86599.1 colanic acid biosynthesis glycosyl-transferase [Candidatus Symbiobacter mobilis CR]
MRIALIADTFPPLRTSGAVQLRDLSREFVRQGHALTVLLPTPGLETLWRIDDYEGAEVLRLRASPLSAQRWDGVVWYSPSIFHGPLAGALKCYAQIHTKCDFLYQQPSPDCGQFSCFTAHPGMTRGGHYHHTNSVGSYAWFIKKPYHRW